jgi:hypothetical protein
MRRRTPAPGAGAPLEDEIAERLGRARAAWRALLASLPGLEREWKTYSRSGGPTLRLKDGGRAVLYLQPEDGRFQAVVVLGERAAAAALATRLPACLRAAIESARPYVEGRSVRVAVQRPADLRHVRTLLAFKQGGTGGRR